MAHQDPESQQRKLRGLIPSAIQGTFIPVSPKKHRSPSPQRHKPKKSVQINFNLTENQMDKLTDVFIGPSNPPSRRGRTESSSAGNGTAPGGGNGLGTPPSRSRARDRIALHLPEHSATIKRTARGQLTSGHESDSTTFSDLMPRSPPNPHNLSSLNIAERRKHGEPTPVELRDLRQYGGVTQNVIPSSPVAHPMTPTKPAPGSPIHPDSSSVYSQDEAFPSPHSVDRVHKTTGDGSVLESYHGWEGSKASALEPEMASKPKGRFQALLQPDLEPGQLYSPLRPYFAYKELPAQKIAGKTLIGEQGWLERPAPNADRKKDMSPKRPGLLDSLKKMAKEMAESKPKGRQRDAGRGGKVSRLTISLDPREQSLLYCELEFHIGNALHTYITNELNHGRLNPDKLKKIADGWIQKGRPRVVGFRYDMETQLDLIHLHVDEFCFFGHGQGNPLELAGLLHAMKINARALRIRTFCQPDSVIAKQLVDSQSLCNAIGCSEAQQIAIAEVAQFFKVIVEREQAYREKLVRDVTAKTLPSRP